MKNTALIATLWLLFTSCTNPSEKEAATPASIQLEEAERLIALPLACVEKKYPYKLGQVLGDSSELKTPLELHPIFYGCFDWHSAVHGYWSMVKLISTFPELSRGEEIREILANNITAENVAKELAYFEPDHNKSFERTYGWAWYLKLVTELHNWDDPRAREFKNTLQPLTDFIIKSYLEFLPKLVYPIRSGEHPNTAFGLSFAYDYAETVGHAELKSLIEKRAVELFGKDKKYSLVWEPSGFDFLSPGLEEIEIMLRVLPKEEFMSWIDRFLPELRSSNFNLIPGKVGDRTDGKLVHLDGLNFSRAWVLFKLAKEYPKEFGHLVQVANDHIAYSYPNLIGDSYEGGHWLGSFAIYALSQ
ncbi:MAG: DUF2891 domain-containing protein [Bacteroidota bacterium]